MPQTAIKTIQKKLIVQKYRNTEMHEVGNNFIQGAMVSILIQDHEWR